MPGLIKSWSQLAPCSRTSARANSEARVRSAKTCRLVPMQLNRPHYSPLSDAAPPNLVTRAPPPQGNAVWRYAIGTVAGHREHGGSGA